MCRGSICLIWWWKITITKRPIMNPNISSDHYVPDIFILLGKYWIKFISVFYSLRVISIQSWGKEDYYRNGWDKVATTS